MSVNTIEKRRKRSWLLYLILCKETFFEMSVGWRGWFVNGLLHPRLQIRPWSESVDFLDAENQQRPCRMNMRYVEDP
ncbi:hypothetical protein TNCV_1312491 [Trichonephila clavipes]|nr:hypothetical protein TNCV_1312491 [Trichonephila clavipes]